MCFSMDFIKQILILAVVIIAVLSILGLLIPFIVGRLGLVLGEGWAVCVRAFQIFVWALVAIIVIIFCFELISCLMSYTGGSLLPRSR
jgi:ABC-type dipeptide/oligopeptide/nickel transport system permease subunit